MQFFTLALFATSALAISLPQWDAPSNSPSRLSSSSSHKKSNSGKSLSSKDFSSSSSSPSSEDCDGDENGCYAHQCSCDLIDPSSDSAPQQDDHLGEEACNYLAESYPNLYWNVGEGCVDSHNRGVSPEGMRQVCSMLAKEEYGEEYDAQANCAY
ncbi:hypothetical protein SMMN14_07757 [Sphaerulina musiva]